MPAHPAKLDSVEGAHLPDPVKSLAPLLRFIGEALDTIKLTSERVDQLKPKGSNGGGSSCPSNTRWQRRARQTIR